MRAGHLSQLAAALDACREQQQGENGLTQAARLGSLWHAQREVRLAEFLEWGTAYFKAQFKGG